MSIKIKVDAIEVLRHRQRTDPSDSHVCELAEDIQENGLYHAPIVYSRGDNTYRLVAGECRLRAIKAIYSQGGHFLYGEDRFPAHHALVPVNVLSGEDWRESDLETIELHENLIRRQLTWQDRVRAIIRLHELRELEGEQTQSATAEEIAEDSLGSAKVEVFHSLLFRNFLDDPEVMGAESRQKALKVMERKARERMYEERRAARGPTSGPTSGPAEVGVEVKAPPTDEQGAPIPTPTPTPAPTPVSVHTFIEGDCHEELTSLPAGSFKCILTDPPYGIGIGDSHWGRAGAKYSDEAHEAMQHYEGLFSQAARLLSPDGFLWTFCDTRLFPTLISLAEQNSLEPWPIPLIWDRTPKGLLPVPSFGPRRCYEAIFCARRPEGRLVLEGRGDVLRYTLEPQYQRPGEKPWELYRELLSRCCYPGDKVLDPFAGTGPILRAADSLMLEATAIERDPYAAEICRDLLEVL